MMSDHSDDYDAGANGQLDGLVGPQEPNKDELCPVCDGKHSLEKCPSWDKTDPGKMDIYGILNDHHCIVTEELGKECVAALNQYFLAQVLGLIGEDESLKGTDFKGWTLIKWKNEYRAELRQSAERIWKI